jgi:hypothetical protein
LARRLGHLATSLGGFFVTCAAMCLTLAVSLCNSDLALRLVALRLGPPGSRCPRRINQHSGD